ASGSATLIPIEGAKRVHLLKIAKGLKADSIPAGLYPNTGKIETVSVQAMWIVHDSIPDSTVYSLAKALFNPANHGALTGSHRSAQFIRLDSATASSAGAPASGGGAVLLANGSASQEICREIATRDPTRPRSSQHFPSLAWPAARTCARSTLARPLTIQCYMCGSATRRERTCNRRSRSGRTKTRHPVRNAKAHPSTKQ